MSKGLEALESGIEVNTKEYGNCIAYTQDCIDIIEKELKALEIVVKKNVVTSWVKSGVSLEEYNDNGHMYYSNFALE